MVYKQDQFVVLFKDIIYMQMILYDTPGVIEKKMHKLDSMMMNNVRSAAVNADCVLVVVDACKAPEQVFLLIRKYQEIYVSCLTSRFLGCRLMKFWKRALGTSKINYPFYLS